MTAIWLEAGRKIALWILSCQIPLALFITAPNMRNLNIPNDLLRALINLMFQKKQLTKPRLPSLAEQMCDQKKKFFNLLFNLKIAAGYRGQNY